MRVQAVVSLVNHRTRPHRWIVGAAALVAALGFADPPAASAAERKVVAITTVDVGAGSNVGNGTGIRKRRDQLEVYASGAALRSIKIEWRQGVRLQLPSRQGAPRLLLRFDTTSVPDPVLGVGTDTESTGQPQSNRDERYWVLPRKTGGLPAELSTRGTGKALARLRLSTNGGYPWLAIDRLPKNTVTVSLGTTGRIGTSLLQRTGACGTAIGQQRAVVSGEYAGGGTFRVLAGNESC